MRFLSSDNPNSGANISVGIEQTGPMVVVTVEAPAAGFKCRIEQGPCVTVILPPNVTQEDVFSALSDFFGNLAALRSVDDLVLSIHDPRVAHARQIASEELGKQPEDRKLTDAQCAKLKADLPDVAVGALDEALDILNPGRLRSATRVEDTTLSLPPAGADFPDLVKVDSELVDRVVPPADPAALPAEAPAGVAEGALETDGPTGLRDNLVSGNDE